MVLNKLLDKLFSKRKLDLCKREVGKASVVIHHMDGTSYTKTIEGYAAYDYQFKGVWHHRGSDLLENALSKPVIVVDCGRRIPLCNINHMEPMKVEEHWIEVKK